MVLNINNITKKRNPVVVNPDILRTTIKVAERSVLNSNYDGDKYYEYEWRKPVTAIKINHNLNKKPSVTVIDTAGNEIIGDVDYVDQDNLTLKFSAAVRGTAYLN